MPKIACPICDSQKFFKIKVFLVKNLISKWKARFNFNPFLCFAEKEITKYNCLICDCNFFYPTFAGDDKFYQHIASKIPEYYGLNRFEYDIAIEVIKKYKPNSLAEFGCGSGIFLEKIRNAVDNLVGIEINPEAVQKCKADGFKLTEDIEQKFDAIVSFQVFEHLDNFNEIFEKCINNLNKEGILLLAVPNPAGFAKSFDNIFDIPPHHQLGIGKKTFEYLASKYNLKLIEYHAEPLQVAHTPRYVYEGIKNNISKSTSISSKIINNIFRFFSFILAINYINQINLFKRNEIIGDAHTAVFQK